MAELIPVRQAHIHGGYGGTCYHVKSVEPISAEAAMTFQRNAGYHPAGYGFHSFQTWETLEVGSHERIFVAKWSRSNSCD